MAGKGDKQRPLDIPYSVYQDNYDAIFRKKEVKHTPDEWCKLKNVVIMDPDGWRNTGDPSWDTPITEADFNTRASISTQRFSPPQ